MIDEFNPDGLMVCQDCLRLYHFDVAYHEEDKWCDCGGQVCGCKVCDRLAHTIIKDKQLKSLTNLT